MNVFNKMQVCGEVEIQKAVVNLESKGFVCQYIRTVGINFLLNSVKTLELFLNLNQPQIKLTLNTSFANK